MNYNEFAFFNNQLAGMLKSGLPLEGSLRQLSSGMRRGKLQRELAGLEKELKTGVPLGAALEKTELPIVYKNLVHAGALGNDLPGALMMMADYYQRLHNLATKLKGLMVYPIIVLTVALGLTLLLTFLVMGILASAEYNVFGSAPNVPYVVWLNPALFLFLLLAAVFLPAIPATRRWLRWKLPGFKDAAIAQFSGMRALLLKNGTELDRALSIMESVEGKSKAGAQVRVWRELLRQGSPGFVETAGPRSVFPPLFRWLVAQGGEDLASGFERASEVYANKASQRAEMLLNSALPIAVLTVGAMVVAQLYPFAVFINQALGF
jgi:type II secretory pathway component PulF